MLSAPICSVLGTRGVLRLWVQEGGGGGAGGATLGFSQGTPQDGGAVHVVPIPTLGVSGEGVTAGVRVGGG